MRTPRKTIAPPTYQPIIIRNPILIRDAPPARIYVSPKNLRIVTSVRVTIAHADDE